MRRRFLIGLQAFLLIAMLVVIASPAASFAKRTVAHWQSRTVWENWKSTPKESVESGEPAGWLRIPGAAVDALVLTDANKANLAKHPCLHLSSYQPGAPKVIMAHRDTHFRGLRKLADGDALVWETSDGEATEHRVVQTEIVLPEAVPQALEKAGSNSVVLMTCWPFDYIGPAPKRILFHCRRHES